MDHHPFHPTQNHYSPKMDVLPKKFLQIILAAKWLVRHSSTSPKPEATTFAGIDPCCMSVNILCCKVGDPLALLFEIQDGPLSPYQLFVRELVAMDGKDTSEILLIDSIGSYTTYN